MKRVKTGIIGLGRLGMLHATDTMFRLPNSELIAACSVVESERQTAASWGVKHIYENFDSMIANPEIEAVIIVSPSGMHAQQIISALRAGKHVFSEKPMGLNVEECLEVEREVEKHPELVFQLGFMRRYDPSYAAAKQKIESGAIGRPIIIKATSLDPLSAIEGFLKFAPTSGGQFLDMAVHDIDLSMWYFGKEVTSIYATGDAYMYPEVLQYQDGDNAVAVLNFEGGEVAILHAGRTAPNGYQVETEIIGTEATLRISAVPNRDRIEIYNGQGVLVECVQGFQERFAQAFLMEKEDFFSCIIESKKSKCGAKDGTRTTRVAFAATQAYRTREIVKL